MNVPAPLFRDPIYDGATDPTVIYSSEENCWYMFYTQRRSSQISIGFSSVHGSNIGIATSQDGTDWLYRGTASGLEFERGHNTFWAPEVIFAKGKYHMYVSYVKGIPTTWKYDRHIIHYTSDNLWEWKFESILELSSNRVIDACVYEIEDGLYKMWYKDEQNHSFSYTAISRDLYNWEVLGREISDVSHEGPNVFELGQKKWMITDFWSGLAVYSSEDFKNWERHENILDKSGVREDDGGLGHHADVVVAGEVAYIFYFVHPGQKEGDYPKGGIDNNPAYHQARTSIQVAMLEVKDGKLVCDRNKDFEMLLRKA